MKKAVATLAVCLLFASAAFATDVYDNEADFLAAIEPGYYLEDFGNPAASILIGPVAPFGPGGDGYAWTATADDDLYIWGSDYAGGTPCVGSLGTNGPNFTVTITMTGADTLAFGGNLYLTDQVFGPVTGDMTVALDDGTSVTLTSPYASDFIGFTTDVPITSVTLTPEFVGVNLYVTVDNIYAGVPEPGALALLALGALAAIRRR